MRAVRLKTEYLYDPTGIDMVRPRLFWNCEEGIRQRAYEIRAFDPDGRCLWDSGKVEEDGMRVRYGGKPCKSRDKVLWHVRLWDENDQPGPWSRMASFEMGLLAPEDWKGIWITGNYRPRRHRRYPVDWFCREFHLAGVKKARLYITACGVYEARLNGARVGNFILAPGITDYSKRIQYQTYDVTNLIKTGINKLTVALGDGWYRGSTGAWGKTCQYGTQTKLLAQLEITDMDGKDHVIATDETWSWSDDGPIRFADNKDGEWVDARKSPTFHGKAAATVCPVLPQASDNVFVTEHEHFLPKLLTTPSGVRVLDFGQNIAGYVSFHIHAHEGERVLLRFGEMLDEKGEFTQKNIQCVSNKKTTPLQQVKYICCEGENCYKTTFAVFGFRYVAVETTAAFKPEDFQAIAVYSDLEETGSFQCSEPLLNRFYENTVWSTKGNSCDLPTDCPTRERHGWTGDAQIFCRTGTYLFDYMPFAKKYLNDVYDQQKKNGCLPQIAPPGGVDWYMKVMDGSVGWADAGVLMPWSLWKQYQDEEILNKFYKGMKKYAAFMKKRCGRWYPTAVPTGLSRKYRKYLSNCGQAYGEWAEPADVYKTTWKDCAVTHPEEETAYTAKIMDCMKEISQTLGDTAAARQYRDFGEKVKRSYQALSETSAYSLDTDRQARLVRPLAFGLLNEKQEVYAKKRLIKALEHYGWRIGTGFLSTPLILDVLAGIDIEAAYRLLENREMPGWLFMAESGATTVWEAWEGTKAVHGIASLNHYSKGAVCQWFFETMCGIHVTGKNTFSISPMPGGHLTWARASYKSVFGTVESGWEKTEDGIKYTVKIPANCQADVTLPGMESLNVLAGEYTWVCEKSVDKTQLCDKINPCI